MITFIKYLFLFLLILAAQIFVFDPISYLVIARPFILFYAVLILPPMQGWLYLLLAFAMGLSYDVFAGTPGIHAGATVLLAYVRDPILRALKEDETQDHTAHITYLGLGKFFFFAVVVSLMFHTLAELLTVFSSRNISTTFLRIGINTVTSAVLIYLLDIILFYRRGATE